MPQFCLLLLQNVDKPLKKINSFKNFYMRDVILCSSIQANQLTFDGKSKYRRSCADWSKPTPIKSINRPSAL